jgi:beta-lactamase class A
VAAPELGQQPTTTLPQGQTLVDLYHLRDRLGRELSEHPTVRVATRSGVGIAPAATLDQLWAVDRRLQQEETARRLWHRAEQSAAAAIALGQPATLPEASLVAAYTLWDQAASALEQVAGDTWRAPQAAARRRQYEQQRAIAAYYYDTARSDFLVPIVDATGMARRVRLTVCNLQRECRRWQGNQPPASPASLIKVPVAIALMANLHEAGVAPQHPAVGQPRQLDRRCRLDLGQNGVSPRTNHGRYGQRQRQHCHQPADRLPGLGGGQPMLHSQSYRATRIRTKLVGETTYPANAGNAPNTITTDELTDMMVAIYNREIPHADLIQGGAGRPARSRPGPRRRAAPQRVAGRKNRQKF